MVYCGSTGSHALLPSDQALKKAGIEALVLGSKEGLGLLNGKALSSGAASLVLFEANQLLLISQLLTAVGTEAVLGNRRNYHSFISHIRPHSGQKEAAANIYKLLEGSKLAIDDSPDGEAKLAQDRYSWRTAPQCIGPQLENIQMVHQQVQTEFNSTTDNPMLDPSTGEVYHGGNFQAASITTAMEKTMAAMQMCSELINPNLSNGLPPNLSVDNPNLSFALKGVDINMAAYMSELAYLARPVSNYMQSAEMHNQSLNSFALVASRYAGDTVELLSLMAASYLYVICQALDLRALHVEFVHDARPKVNEITSKFVQAGSQNYATEVIQNAIWDEVMIHWTRECSKDLPVRSSAAVTSSLGRIWQLVGNETRCGANMISQQWMN
ncbi:unnamed protein product [Penicillium bialowiezense]